MVAVITFEDAGSDQLNITVNVEPMITSVAGIRKSPVDVDLTTEEMAMLAGIAKRIVNKRKEHVREAYLEAMQKLREEFEKLPANID
jgi:hypothetical protein